MTTYATTPRTLDEQAQSLIDSEVYCCQSMLVEALLKEERDGFTIDDIENFYFPASLLSREELEEFHADRGLDIRQEEEESDADYLRRLQNEYDYDNEPQQIYEWYAVSVWLARQLTEIGEPVIDNDFGQWWGRGATGQSIIQDRTFQKIAQRLA